MRPPNKGMKLAKTGQLRSFAAPIAGVRRTKMEAKLKKRGRTTAPEEFVAARRSGDTSPPRELRLRRTDGEVEDLILSADELRRFRKTIAEVREKRRYLLVRAVVRGFTFYYNVTDHGYGLNRPQQATLFHQRDQAKAVAALLGPEVEVIQCKTRTRNGVLLPVVPSKLRVRGEKAIMRPSNNRMHLTRSAGGKGAAEPGVRRTGTKGMESDP